MLIPACTLGHPSLVIAQMLASLPPPPSVCVCVCERERERERETLSVILSQAVEPPRATTLRRYGTWRHRERVESSMNRGKLKTRCQHPNTVE